MRRTVHLLLSALCCCFFLQVSAQTTTTNTLAHDGLNRGYVLHIPPEQSGQDYPPSLPLVIVLHGLGDTGNGIMLGSGFNELADANNFVAVYPDAIEDPLWGTAWNNGLVGINGSVDDIGFLNALIDEIDALEEIDIDPERIYATGFSMGGFMTNTLACEMNDRITAFASVAGTLVDAVESDCAPERLIPLMHFHGTADPVVTYEGGFPPFIHSAEETAAYWAAHNNCDADPSIIPIPDAYDDGITAEKWQYENCDGVSETVFFKIYEGVHTWYQPTNDVYYSQVIWNFFEQFTMSDFNTNVSDNLVDAASGLTVTSYPTPVGDLLNITANDRIELVQLYDLNGRLLVQKQLGTVAQQAHLNLETLAAGTYILAVKTPLGSNKQLMVKQ